MDLNRKIQVWNRSRATVVYTIPELRIKRKFMPSGEHGDMLLIPVEELQALLYIPGGHKILLNSLLIKEQDVCEFLGIPTEPEYFYGIEEIRTLLKDGSMEQLMDCLEFAPVGVKDLIKKIAIEEKLDSHEKRQLISKTMKINLDAMIRNNDLSETSGNEGEEPVNSRRRAQPIVAPVKEEAPIPKYNVVNRK